MPSPKDDVEARPPCHPRACAIQDCLVKNNYNETRCQNAVKALYECCEAFYQRYGDDATSPSCPLPKLLRLKIQQQKEGK
ncbi:hypothetical protein M441DRAFT_53785 [Trichoderma asperellum CBS 433.97]|uniref:Cx9C motif-containing protein 4, mitochondrial n=1 Tax=Trichoderma asperellum (strain ATCC 204424 / CBS 433.97 / NBRC 101777) TaxID=1042311 RepID=A0A2T3ZQL9_TRIA4|nr:hypothetical protein M441DRAFT_53785 [Trichoderma asperellum CBS 433.97]PTB47110.1 hypothetical protein M441DRAFT_53785 [Trichoderma asperellum CBS 433.97]